MTRTISIIGAGRVGKTVGRCLRRLGWRVEAVTARSEAHARAAVRWIGGGTPHGRLTSGVLAARVILLAVPDDPLAKIARELARLDGTNLRGKVVLHTSGALDSGVLEPMQRRGASTGSIHPMQTFTGRGTPKLKNIVFAIEGAPAAVRAARQIARDLGGTPVIIDRKGKAAYHAAGTLVAGHALALLEASTRILMRLGFTRARALRTLLPLTRQMLENFEAVGPRGAWTGPIARKDYAVVTAHAKALHRLPVEFRDAYAALALLSGRVLADHPSKAIARIRRALAAR